jgi:hypothetical protein
MNIKNTVGGAGRGEGTSCFAHGDKPTSTAKLRKFLDQVT